MARVVNADFKELAGLTTPRLRTCIATRKRQPDVQLLRVVIDPNDPQRRRILADPHRKLPGRGAWLSPDVDALELAQRNRAFGRALRTSAHVDTEHVRAYLDAKASGSPQVPGHSGPRPSEWLPKPQAECKDTEVYKRKT
ncbi:YlxR family protein [Corynebacterium lizhenjunii]|uniref:YlxR family protein n=1 Tax=Corynebacterium lizhenjunii TaxID=2709394 RepID=A0A7T0KD71_9CORY|nr:YlxR family protein [Corynebacterium lizhenjunii]QPK78397.1 YlxR family protein [Corynebacterium lizhenjunii]